MWIRKGIEARRTRNEGRVRRLERLREARSARRERIGTVNLVVDRGERSGELIAELTHVSKVYADKAIIKDFSTRILRGDRVGLIGPNGAGKTTLLKLVLGEITPDAGSVRLGTKLMIRYFDQLRAALDDDATLADTISPGADFIQIGNERKHVLSYLGDFLFPPERARAKVKSLSGGERNRLLLARELAQPANVLILDEPTNDLDLETLELLEALLQEYAGTLFLVSHDREFLNNVVTQVIAFEGGGTLVEYAGGYDNWERVHGERAARPEKEAPLKERAPQPRARPVKLTFKENTELAALPGKIEALEREQADIGARLAEPDFYRKAAEDVRQLRARLDEIDALLERALIRWEELEAKRRSNVLRE